MIVIGAGMAGLLAGAMLRGDCSKIVERQPSLPNNHSAVMRFRSSLIADILNIPFKRVQVMKAVAPWRNNVADAMAYSKKTNGSYTLRSILSANGTFERFIAPPDLIERMAACVGYIEYGSEGTAGHGEVLISTMPMPALMDALEYPGRDSINFRSIAGRNIVAQVADMDAYASLYVPDPQFPGARISLCGNEMIIECYGAEAKFMEDDDLVEHACYHAGIAYNDVTGYRSFEQRYAKILPIDNNTRERFILWATEHFRIYSLGRFATWRPGLLLDDVVNDVRVIHRLAGGQSSYSHRK